MYCVCSAVVFIGAMWSDMFVSLEKKTFSAATQAISLSTRALTIFLEHTLAVCPPMIHAGEKRLQFCGI